MYPQAGWIDTISNVDAFVEFEKYCNTYTESEANSNDDLTDLRSFRDALYHLTVFNRRCEEEGGGSTSAREVDTARQTLS